MQKQPHTLDDLRPARVNPRTITDRAAEGLGECVQRYGDISGIVWNERSGRLVCGHQRVERLRQLGGQIVRGAIQIASGHRFPIRVVDWDEATEQAANVAANNPHIAGHFTDELDELLEKARASLGSESFSELRLDELLTKVPKFDEAEDGDVPDLSNEGKRTCPNCGHEF